MLGEEEFVQERIHLQQSFAVQPHVVPIDLQEPFMPQLAEWAGEPLMNVDPELTLKVSAVDMPALHLENQLADHALLRCWGQRPIDRKGAILKLADVGAELVLVLKMRA